MRIVSYLFLVCLLSSCLGSKRAVYNYLEDIKDTSFKKSVYIAEPIIQKLDLLSIIISSKSLVPSLDQPYNMQGGSQGGGGGTQNQGYLVDIRGNLELPRIGSIHVEGLTKSELQQVIITKLKDVLLEPIVLIRFLNFRFTVLGTGTGGGVVTAPTERLTILEAIAMAGGITENSAIKRVRVLRENDGVRQTGILDLTSQSIFQSPYYQVQQNDVILIDQTSYGLRQAEQQRITTQIGFALGIISTVGLLYNLFK